MLVMFGLYELRYNLCVGGTLIRDNIDELLKNPQIIIGTLDVLDMINKKALNTAILKFNY